MVDYDETKSGVPAFDLKECKEVSKGTHLYFRFPRKVPPRVLGEYDAFWSNVLIPLIGPRIIEVLNRMGVQDVQLVPCTIENGAELLEEQYYLLNPLTKVQAVDGGLSEPQYAKIPGFPDALIGYKKLRFKEIPATAIARQEDFLPHILVGESVAGAIDRMGAKGVRLARGIPPR